MAKTGVGLAGRLGKAVVELAHAPAGHVGKQTVKDGTASFVQVQAKIDHMAQQAAALRYPVTIDALVSALHMAKLPGLTQPGGRFANSQHPAAHHHRVRCRVDGVINLARLEASLQADVLGVGEMPLRTGDNGVGPVFPIADQQHGVGVVKVGDGIGSVFAVGEEPGGLRGVGTHLHAGLSGDRRTINADARSLQSEQGGAAVNVPLPTDGEDGIAVAKEKTVTFGNGVRIDWRCRPPVEKGDGAAAAPVHRLDYNSSVAAGSVFGRHQGKV